MIGALIALLPLVNPFYAPSRGLWFVGMGFVDVEGTRGDVVLEGGGRWGINRGTSMGARVGLLFEPLLILEGDLSFRLHQKNADIPFDFGLTPELSLGIGRDQFVVFAPRLYAHLAWMFSIESDGGKPIPIHLYLSPFIGGYFYNVKTAEWDPNLRQWVSRRKTRGEMDGGLRISTGGAITRRMGWDMDVMVGRFTFLFSGALTLF